MNNINSVMKGSKVSILRRNIINMAVGATIGGAFSKTVTSFVNDILMPPLGALIGGVSFNILKYVIHPTATVDGVEIAEAAIPYGSFLQDILDLLIIGACMFFMIKTAAVINSRLRHEEEAKEEASVPTGPAWRELLVETRDLLKGHGDIA